MGIVDDWGNGFVDELNYLKEANNAQVFMESIASTSLKDVVFAPTVIGELSTKKVLVTEWVQGDRLDKSNAADEYEPNPSRSNSIRSTSIIRSIRSPSAPNMKFFKASPVLGFVSVRSLCDIYGKHSPTICWRRWGSQN